MMARRYEFYVRMARTRSYKTRQDNFITFFARGTVNRPGTAGSKS